MGYPLRKLHQIHSVVPAPPVMRDGCNNRTMTGSRPQAPPKHMELHGFVAKNEPLEKPYRKPPATGPVF